MKALVVHAHPDPDSFSHEVRARVVSGLESAGHTVDVIDLYAVDYRAAMSRNEHLAYSSPTPILDSVVVGHAEQIRSCDVLVFVYPTWWSSFPAILNGWIERTLVQGVAFELDEESGKLKPLLTNIARLIGVTTHGSPRWYVKIVNDNGRRTMTRTLRACTGLRVKTTWLAMYELDAQSPARRQRFLERVQRAMGKM
ncbi:MAG: NAD(P)H-dependent oxidoreductase [Actinomycetota bacterium]